MTFPHARTKARKRALDLLFASEVRGRSAVDALDEEISDAATEPDGRPVADYTGGWCAESPST